MWMLSLGIMAQCLPNLRWTVRQMPSLRRAFSSDFNRTSFVLPTNYEHNNTGNEKRHSRRRYSAANTKGRSKHIDNVIASLKVMPKAQRRTAFDNLHPRDRLDVLRSLHRRRESNASGLPTYKSHLFERRYFFREEDLTEQSTLGRGPGGQATNRRMQTSIVKHVSTGITVKFSRFPSYWMNRRMARELLNLRLEEHWCGPDSKLGRIKRRLERRRLRRLRTTQKLVEKGSVLRAMLTQQRQFFAVLTGEIPFPPQVVSELTLNRGEKSFYLRELFEGECSRWWPMLVAAFNHANDGNSISVVPELIWYVFPAVIFSSPPTAVQNYEWDQVRKCAKDEVALCNVKRGFRCFVELFGLCLHEPRIDGEKLSIETDGLNWLELRGRMVASAEAMTPLAIACCRHVYRSLLQLECSHEANALLMFFERESRIKSTKRDGKSHWALQGWSALKEVEGDNEHVCSLTKI